MTAASPVARARAAAGLAAAGLALAAAPLAAQACTARPCVRAVTAQLVVPYVGSVRAASPLTIDNARPGSDVYLYGTVTSTGNGAFQLQARVRAGYANTVYAPDPATQYPPTAKGAPYALLVPQGTFVTIATGVAGPGRTTPVYFRLVWGKGGPRTPAEALALASFLEYRVVAK